MLMFLVLSAWQAHRTILTLSGLILAILLGLVISGRSLATSHVLPFQVLAQPSKTFLPLILRNTSTAAGSASWSTPIALSPSGDQLWVVNPDSNSVTVIPPENSTNRVEISVDEAPWSLAVSPDGTRVYVIARTAGTLMVIDAHNYSVQDTVFLGPEPIGIVLNATGTKAYVTLYSSNEVVVLDTHDLEILARMEVDKRPYAIAITDRGDNFSEDKRIYVTHFLALPRPGGEETTDDGREGRITVINPETNMILNQITLNPNEHGFPNILSGIAVHEDRAWVPLVQAAPALPNSLTTIVFAAVWTIDLAGGIEDVQANLPLNDQIIFGSPVNNPVAVVPSPDGKLLYIVLAGSDLIEVVDISIPQQPRLERFIPVGLNPRGMTISADGQTGYVMNYLSRSVTVLDLAQFTVMAEIPVTTETLSPQELRGKILFNNASDPRLSQGSWISCASCHPDGGADGVTWFFPDGPRQSPPLWNATQTLPWHWSAALDESQDVEDTIERIQHGLGLAPGPEPPLLGAPNAGRSLDLDALALFLMNGIPIPAPPTREDVEAGRALFVTAGCVSCHGGPTWTSSALPGPPGMLDPDGNGMVDAVLRDVGTFNSDDIRGATGFDPPSLLNVGLTEPYFHDGSMPSLAVLLVSGHPDPKGNGNGLTSKQINSLVRFLETIGPETEPFLAP